MILLLINCKNKRVYLLGFFATTLMTAQAQKMTLPLIQGMTSDLS